MIKKVVIEPDPDSAIGPWTYEHPQIPDWLQALHMARPMVREIHLKYKDGSGGTFILEVEF